MKLDIRLSFDGGYLKPLSLDDVHDAYVQGLNDPEVNRYLDSVKQTMQTKESVADFVQYNESAKDALLFGIWRVGDQQHCGTLRIHGIEKAHKTANIGICIFDKSVWGHGLGSKAVRAASEWALDYFPLRWIEAGAYEQNIASQKTFISAGYSWICDIAGKYLFEGKSATVKIYAYTLTESSRPNN